MTAQPLFTRRSLLVWLGAACAAPQVSARPAAAPALMLAREASPDVDPSGFLVSEKFDGARAVWDGSTLRFRSGLPVAAPAWFTSRLPPMALDGELWMGRGRFEALAAAVRRREPNDAEWRAVRYQVFDLPGAAGTFAERAARIAALARTVGGRQLVAVEQAPVASQALLARRFADVVREGGEGLMLHRASALWQPGRSEDLLKLKPLADAEATVIGHVAGRGRLEGRLGALRVRGEDGAEFLIGTGFSDGQRADPPPLGSVVTFTHRGSTAGGVPRFASFLRVRGV
jgi:DNA ligase-1